MENPCFIIICKYSTCVVYSNKKISDDYKMAVMLINQLTDKPSSILKAARKIYLQKKSMTMEKIDEEIQNYSFIYQRKI